MSKFGWGQILIVLALILAFKYFYLSGYFSPEPAVLNLNYTQFKAELSKNNLKSVTFTGQHVDGVFNKKVPAPPGTPAPSTTPPQTTTQQPPPEYDHFKSYLPALPDDALLKQLEQHKVEIKSQPPAEPSPWSTMLLYLLPWVLIIGIWWVILKGMRNKGGAGGKLLGGFSQSGAKLYNRENSSVTFDDVAGLEEAKQELMELVEFLRNPKKFTSIGGKVPKGVLLAGPPGTGKTLMARAVAGEADVPFFSISASQFIEMFVGVGASRVRDLFTSAKKNAPSIIFIDELDAVGRARGTGLGGGHDEREQTLNQLLSEMDGFESHTEVIVLAATNRPDVLDAALLRPGRFDRQVVLDRPDWHARESILQVHTRKIPLADDVDLQVIARGTPGMCGADLENLVNEAALMAAREDLTQVTMNHLERAKDRILMGAERKIALSPDEVRLTAYHEAGHTLVALLSPHADPIHKVSIIPRGHALGVTQQLPVDDRYQYSKAYLTTRIAVSLGGRAAEKVVFDDFSTGAQNDLKQATELAEKMVCQWGMSERVGPVTFNRGEEHPFLGRKLASDKSFSERMAWRIDLEIEKLLRQGEETADVIIRDNRPILENLANALLEEEVLDRERVESIVHGEKEGNAPSAHQD